MNRFRQSMDMAPQSASANSDDRLFFRTLKAGALCTIALGAGITTSAYAQDAAKSESAESRTAGLTLDEVTVTGTRIQQRGDYASPNPITTIGSDDLQKLGIVNISDAMTQIPQNVSQFTPANTGGSAFFVGSTLANLRGLNPFFGTRTLTLVDSRRFIPTTQGDSVDLNFIPSNLIQRMEVVTGGASAAYGSGAISGVVNVILDKKLQGVKLDVDYGQTSQSDGDNYHVGLAGGTDLFGGRGHIIAGGEYQKSQAINSCSDARDWCAKGLGLYNNGPAFAANNVPFTAKIPGLPQYVVASNLRYNQINNNGVIYNNTQTATTTSAFNDAGTGLVPFAIGQAGGFAPGGSVIGGDGPPTYKNITLYPEVNRKTGFTHMDFELTDNLSAYAEGSYGQVKGVNHQWSPFQGSAYVCVHPDNAYIQGNAPVQAAIATKGNNYYFANNQGCGDLAIGIGFPPGSFGPYLAGTAITKDWSAQNDDTVTTDTKVIRGVVGLNGKIGQSTWTWDAYYQYGKTTRDQIGTGYRTNWRYEMATDAVIDTRATSPTFGKPVCRVTLTGVLPSPAVDPSLAVGCQPLNPFGTTGASQAAMAYAFGSLTEHDDIRQDVVAGSLTGEVWKGWGAGPLSAAVGAEYRKDELANLAGDLPFAQRTDFGLQYGDSFGGTTKITEEFVELEMPLLRDKPGAQVLTLNTAGRHASYDQQGGIGTTGASKTVNIDTWKVALVWDPIDWLRFRGSLSSDLRAPGFRELYYSQSIPAGGFFGTVNNPFIPANRPGGIADQSVLILSGDPTLSPEKARTSTFGLVLSPKGWAQTMHFSADYYKIKLTGGLSLGSAQDTVAKCFAGNQTYCGYLTFGTPLNDTVTGKPIPNSNITSVRDFYLNQSPYETKGIDFSWDYLLALDTLFKGADSRVAFRLTASHTISTKIPSGRNVAGQTGGDQGFLSDFASSPDWSGTLSTSYMTGPLTATLQTRYISSGVLDLQNPKRGPGDAGYDPTRTYSVTDNTVPSYFLFDLTGSYDFKWFNLDKLQAFATVNNLFDKVPPFSAGQVGGANATFFDALGRTYRVGMRMAF